LQPILEENQKQLKKNTTGLFAFRQKIQQWIKGIKEFHGNPHYVAMGMAIGVFVALTPTIPFHTIIAVSLAFVLRGSKAAAALGVWVSNPVTIPIFYVGTYKTGVFLFGRSAAGDITGTSITDLLRMGLDVTIATMMAGIIIGILPGIAAYFITRKIVAVLRYRKKSLPENACNSRL